MALTAQQRATILQAFLAWCRGNAPDPQQQVTILLQMLFQSRAQQIAKVREWLAFVKDANIAERDGLSTFVTDKTAALNANVAQLDSADTELAASGGA